MNNFPDKIYGICPLGHNPQPSADIGDNLSTTLIDSNEGRRLYWSNYYQRFVCRMHLDKVQEVKDDITFHEKQLEIDKKLSGMGIHKN